MLGYDSGSVGPGGKWPRIKWRTRRSFAASQSGAPEAATKRGCDFRIHRYWRSDDHGLSINSIRGADMSCCTGAKYWSGDSVLSDGCEIRWGNAKAILRRRCSGRRIQIIHSTTRARRGNTCERVLFSFFSMDVRCLSQGPPVLHQFRPALGIPVREWSDFIHWYRCTADVVHTLQVIL